VERRNSTSPGGGTAPTTSGHSPTSAQTTAHGHVHSLRAPKRRKALLAVSGSLPLPITPPSSSLLSLILSSYTGCEGPCLANISLELRFPTLLSALSSSSLSHPKPSYHLLPFLLSSPLPTFLSFTFESPGPVRFSDMTCLCAFTCMFL